DLGLPGEETSLYTLGPVGIEIAKQRHGRPPLTGYLGYTLQRTLHDLLRNEIVLRFSAFARSLGWSVAWLSHQDATLQKDGEVLLEPDAMLKLKRDGKQKDFLLEYHDENTPIHAWKKFRQYERASRTDVWPRQWETDAFPVVLAVFRNPAIGQGYQSAIKECERVHCTYYGKVLKGVLAGNLAEWVNILTGQREPFLYRSS
ncbi:MAG: replication-relaxation family protein, partial [Chloroflexota bacterium]